MLWEARASLIRRYGYSRAINSSSSCHRRHETLAPNPSFTQARDAIILADQVNNQGANYGDLWRAFARRGLGFSAISPDSSDTAGVVEAFDLPDSLFLINPRLRRCGPQAGRSRRLARITR